MGNTTHMDVLKNNKTVGYAGIQVTVSVARKPVAVSTKLRKITCECTIVMTAIDDCCSPYFIQEVGWRDMVRVKVKVTL